MGCVNMGSILAKAKDCINNDKSGKVELATKKSFNKKKIISANSPKLAADTLISVIASYAYAQLPPNVASIASNLICDDITYNGDKTVTVGISFNDANQLHRRSLIGHITGEDLNNIVALYNSGVNHEMTAVNGLWHGKYVTSRTTIPETRFLQEAIDSFEATFGKEYDVISVKLSSSYE